MTAIIEFLIGIADAVGALIDFLVSMVEDVVYVVELIGSAVASIPDYLSWLPPEVLAVIVSALAVVVIYKILGRD